MNKPHSMSGGKDPILRFRQGILSFSSAGKLQTRPPTTPKAQDRDQLVKIAKETISVLPGLLLTRPDANPDGYLYEKDAATPLDQSFCPRLPKTKIRVISSDTIDAALQLSHGPAQKSVCVLNMANAIRAGGGFKNGALAQEEALCYRTSLHFTLKLRFYPIPDKAAIYSPTVLVIRDSLANGHKLLDCQDPRKLPVISVVSAAAVFQPSLGHSPAVTNQDTSKFYARREDREMMRDKMRVILRTAIKNRHRKIVLGAFGCGAFQNPPKEVARLWSEVLQEPEFSGGWWEEIVFAVLRQGSSDSNFKLFSQELDGVLV
ncbi:uncharacterized protein Z520_09818 [Fonsecaea multimorphosa CBS 102226]|uniref:Microbial-type PARG catalytic domain-containing protein n=1 Tax=Fonsecaea multimorphosa CBS 102226 TaxID=1442371 RepID=A0A0D2JMB0_9EURO|nr:uncharacterized protein Z520_09818 [Fonsecaea multimorphosa CBS 102226]KIX94432.1 hypothetical protein Z520_09818 [Fonsecaea multimorphosa CBS 102226]OAL20013.1 hypothetical protein AYO22_09163 [Fonsecaea multimorphosa]